jgi:hypothetical protein
MSFKKVFLVKTSTPEFSRTDIVTRELDCRITDDSFFYDGGEEIGFFIKDIREYSVKAGALLDIANSELMSKRVPKSGRMGGGGKGGALDKGGTGIPFKVGTSAIIGATPPKPYLGRPYRSTSSLHNAPSAKVFIKSMICLSRETSKVFEAVSKTLYSKHCDSMSGVAKKWTLGKDWTSSVSNISCTVPVHSDKKNIVGTLNAIYCKRFGCTGGNIVLPDYGATIEQSSYSLLVYPAWRDLHGVSPIKKNSGGYRNTLVFYSLSDFVD